MAEQFGRLRVGRALHWTTALLAIAVGVASDPATSATIGALFAVVGGAFVVHALIRRPLAHPGPVSKRSPAMRTVHLAVHRGLLAAVALTILTGLPAGMAGSGVAEAFGGGSAETLLWHGRAYAVMLTLAASHVIVNLWRSSALGEPAFRTMLGDGRPTGT